MVSKKNFPSGLRLLTVPMPGVETVAVLVLVGVGSRYEEEKTNGLAHFTEHMLFQGTKKYPSKLDLAIAVDRVGAEFNGMTDKEYTAYFVKAESRHLGLAIDVLSQMVCEPLIKEQEIEREKNVILQEIAMRGDTPQVQVIDTLWEEVFNGHPLGLSGVGEKKSVLTFQKDHFSDFRQSFYTSANTLVVVSGKFDEKAVLDLVSEKFSLLPKGTVPHFQSFFGKQASQRSKVISKKTDQVHLALGFPAFSRVSKKRYAQSLLDIILGSGMSSRLFQKIREEKSLAYYVGSEAEMYLDTGLFAVTAGVDKKRSKEAVREIWNELTKISNIQYQISNEELRKAKDYLRGKVALRLEEALEVAMFYGMKEILEKKTETPQEVLEKVEKVSREEVIEVAKKLFTPNLASLVVVGDGFGKEKLSLA